MLPDSVKSVNILNPNSYLASGNRAPSVNPNSRVRVRVRVRVKVRLWFGLGLINTVIIIRKM